jgi:hypothetical protein
LGAPLFSAPGCGEREGLGVSDGLGTGLSSGVAVGVGDAFLRFDFVLGVAVGDGVGEIFLCFGEAVGEGLGVVFFAERFRCLRVGVGVAVGARIFLIFVPNESSAAFAAWSVPNEIAAIRSPRNIGWETAKIVGRFCETLSAPASDTDALQFAFWFLIG